LSLSLTFTRKICLIGVLYLCSNTRNVVN
jgi:hypothetical protein